MNVRVDLKMNFKVGDWIILEGGNLLGTDYPVEILKIEGENSYNTFIAGRGIEIYINPEFFRLATEVEIKKEKIRSIFQQ